MCPRLLCLLHCPESSSSFLPSAAASPFAGKVLAPFSGQYCFHLSVVYPPFYFIFSCGFTHSLFLQFALSLISFLYLLQLARVSPFGTNEVSSLTDRLQRRHQLAFFGAIARFLFAVWAAPPTRPCSSRMARRPFLLT